METNTTAADRQAIRGACPHTGRSASVCSDQTHTTCADPAAVALDRKIQAAIA